MEGLFKDSVDDNMPQDEPIREAIVVADDEESHRPNCGWLCVTILVLVHENK